MPLELALQLVLRRRGGGEDRAGVEEIEDAEAVDGGADHDLRPVDLELRRDDRRLHDLERAEHQVEPRRAAPAQRRRPAGDVDRDDDVGAPDQAIEGQRIDGAAVDEEALSQTHRPDHARDGDRGRDRRAERARRECRLGAGVVIGRDDLERQGQILEALRHGLGPEPVEEPLAVDQERVAEA